MNSNEKIVSFIQFQLPVVAWGFFIYVASSISSQNITMLPGFSDKLVHAGVFSIFCWLMHVALFHQGFTVVKKYSLSLAVFFVFVYGLSDEYHQMFTPGRSSDIYDVVADTMGGVTYALVNLRFKFYRNE